MDGSGGSSKKYLGLDGQILQLLGAGGCTPVQVAAALGCSQGRISQLMAQEEFSRQVVGARAKSLAAATDRDRKYDALEDRLVSRMDTLLPTMFKPLEVLRALQVVNGAKRRGTQEIGQTEQHAPVVPILLPQVLIKSLQMNVQNNQVVAVVVGGAGGQVDGQGQADSKEAPSESAVDLDGNAQQLPPASKSLPAPSRTQQLVTIQSGTLLQQIREKQKLVVAQKLAGILDGRMDRTDHGSSQGLLTKILKQAEKCSEEGVKKW